MGAPHKKTEKPFQVKEHALSDESTVHDLNVINEDGDTILLWNTPSQCSAENTEEALNKLLNRFKACDSDRETSEILAGFNDWIERN